MQFWVGITLVAAIAIGGYLILGQKKKERKVVQNANEKRKILVIGLGGIGSTFAFEFSKSGHDVSVVARGKRLEQVQKEGAIVLATKSRERALVKVYSELDTSIEYDAIIVAVLAHQVDVILPKLIQSKAKTIIFAFNMWESMDRLRNAVGPERFVWGFPAIMGRIEPDGSLVSEIVHKGQLTTLTDQKWADWFTENGVTATTETDMQSWLRCHAVLVGPVMVASGLAFERKGGISWNEAIIFAHTVEEGFQMVKRLGHKLVPFPLPVLAAMPNLFWAGLFWIVVRIPSIRALGGAGYGEPRALYAEIKKTKYKYETPWTDKTIALIPKLEN